MNQRESPAASRGSQGKGVVSATDFPRFTIKNLREVTFGRIIGRFDLEIGPVRLLECNLVADSNGHPKFVSAGAVKGYRGEYQSLVELDRDFRSEIFEAVTARLRAISSNQTRRRRRARATSGPKSKRRALTERWPSWAVPRSAGNVGTGSHLVGSAAARDRRNSNGARRAGRLGATPESRKVTIRAKRGPRSSGSPTLSR